jgi:hypothetical protein
MTPTPWHRASEAATEVNYRARMALLAGRPDHDQLSDRIHAVKAFLLLVEAMKAIRADQPEEWAEATDQVQRERVVAGRAAP